jgi:hypothetical protein
MTEAVKVRVLSVDDHPLMLIEKLGANDRTQAVAIGVRRGIIQL